MTTGLENSTTCLLCGDQVPPDAQLERHLIRHLEELALFALPQRGEDEEQESTIPNASAGHIKTSTFADLKITTDDKEVKHDHGAIKLHAVDAFSEETNLDVGETTRSP